MRIKEFGSEFKKLEDVLYVLMVVSFVIGKSEYIESVFRECGLDVSEYNTKFLGLRYRFDNRVVWEGNVISEIVKEVCCSEESDIGRCVLIIALGLFYGYVYRKEHGKFVKNDVMKEGNIGWYPTVVSYGNFSRENLGLFSDVLKFMRCMDFKCFESDVFNVLKS
jgi:hypothetical protein